MKNSAFASALLPLVASLFFAGTGIIPAHAQTQPVTAKTPSAPILSATEHSGYTTAEDAFETHCELSATGQATGYFSSGWNGTGWITTTTLSFQLTARALQDVTNSITAAKAGPIRTVPGQCDAPTMNIIAQAVGDSQSFAITSLPDCAPETQNLNASAADLRVWVANLCKIK